MTRPRLALGVIVAALTLVPLLFGQEATPAASEAPKSKSVLYESPQGSYRLERSRDNKSVWVVSAKNPKEHQVLAGIAGPDEYPDPERFIASPDEKWLVAEGELFQQVRPLKFVVFKKRGGSNRTWRVLRRRLSNPRAGIGSGTSGNGPAIRPGWRSVLHGPTATRIPKGKWPLALERRNSSDCPS